MAVSFRSGVQAVFCAIPKPAQNFGGRAKAHPFGHPGAAVRKNTKSKGGRTR